VPVYLHNIERELRRFPRNPEAYPVLRVVKRSFEVQPQPGMNLIRYRIIVRGETDNYLVYVWFYNVKFTDEPTSADDERTVIKRKVFYYKRPSLRENPVRLKCECDDFRFRFEKELYDNGALIGSYRRYTRKTKPPPIGRPYANPKHVMGYCKHIKSFLRMLYDGGFIE